MSRQLSRRFADALCAFRTGHSVRDLDRVRTRRLLLLGRRLLQSRRKVAEEAFLLPELFWASHRRAANLVRKLGKRGGRIARPALLQELEVERSSLRSSRMRAWAEVRSLDGSREDAVEELKAAPVFSDEGYGKLLDGLGEERVLDSLQHKLRRGVRYWHRFLRAVSVRFHFCIHGKLPNSLIARGRYPVDPGFGTALLLPKSQNGEVR